MFCTPGALPEEQELVGRVPDCAGYLAGVEPITARVLQAAPDLRVIARNGTGVDNIDLAEAARRNIRVCAAAGANARGVAELTLGLMLSLVRSIPLSDATVKRGAWERRQGVELQGRTLGLVGCGYIGRLVTELALAFGMEVVGFDVAEDPAFAPSARFRYAPLNDVLEQADILSLHCPPAERPILGAAALQRMKDGAYIINTARAGLIDNAALLKAIESGKIAGAAMDVVDKNSPEDAVMARHERIIATPHIGAFTEESSRRAVEAAVQNLLNYL
jgi:D-3-phosphoglycerate dehydrogenase